MSRRQLPHAPHRLVCLLLPLTAAALGCSDDVAGTGGESGTADSETGEAQGRYNAQIRRTSHGVPHITADDWGSLAFGQGYAFTEDKGCYLADQLLKVSSQRARWFGAGENNTNVYTDLAYLHLGVREIAEAEYDALAPDVIEGIEGYAAGYNLAVSEGKIGGECAGEAWVPTDISAIDLFVYYLDLALLASSRQAITAVGSAQPPPGGAPGAPADPAPHFSTLSAHRGTLGSNGWAFGSEVTATGRGMLMGNPHFPWEGELQLWESHLRIPDELEVYGAALLGVPGVLIGFNADVAWTHTVSDGHRLTLYEITSPPGEPTSYYYEDEVREMQAQEYTIEVLGEGGEIEELTRTLYRTHYGPMAALEPFYWTPALALSYRDANLGNTRVIEQWLRMSMATSLEDLKAAHLEVNGIPWVNTVATSADGRAWYTDASATPNLSQAAIDAWYERKESGFTAALASQDVWLLDGSASRDEWQEAPGARSPGLVPASEQPQIERNDFVFNANDSYWLANPAQPLTGYSPLHGFTDEVQSVRTRQNASALRAVAEGDAALTGADGKLDLDELTALALANQSYTAGQLRADVVARCTGVNVWDYEGAMVDIAEACDLLASWDGYFNLDSVGALVFRELLGDYDIEDFDDAGELWALPFDAADPINSPSGLADGDRVLDALAAGVTRLDAAGVALDASLGEAQFVRKGAQDIPMHGGSAREGITNMMLYSQLRSDLTPEVPHAEFLHEPTYLTEEGYLVNYGASFVMCLEYTDEGPRGRALLSYSQSANADSPFFADQTEMLSQKQWRPMLWNEEDIVADPKLVEYSVSGGE